jgi:hypothetical protein
MVVDKREAPVSFKAHALVFVRIQGLISKETFYT